MRKDYGTKRVEMAWIAPFRKFAPAALVLCVAILLAILLHFTAGGIGAAVQSLQARLFLLLIYAAFTALAGFLFVEAKQVEETARADMKDAEELWAVNERLSATLESIGEGVIATDVDGTVTLINTAAAQLVGWPKLKATGSLARSIFRVINEDTRQPIEDPSRTALSSGRRVHEDSNALLVSRTGKEYSIAYHAAPLLDGDGWITGAVIVFQDVTGVRAMQRHRVQLIDELSQTNDKLIEEITRREEGRRAALSLMQDAQMAQAALKDSEERLRVLFEGIDDALFVHSPDGRILDCNPAAGSILGHSRERLLALNIRDILRNPTESETSHWLVTKDDLPIPVHVHTSLIKYGGADAYLTVGRDITGLKQIQDELRTSNEQLRESNSALEEYARVASHDLQEPLRKIESFAQVLVEDCGDSLDTKARGYIDIMVGAARRMRRLIRDVLAFSRAGTAEEPFASIDLNKILVTVLDNLSERIQERDAHVVVHDLPTVIGDETQMIQLFQNLVGNGIKFNEGPDPQVEVFSAESESEWKIFVRDNGIGMREGESKVIFAPFKRLHPQQRFEGTGIGLAICRRIVARHGGTIGLQSELNKGSTFWLTLPKPTTRLREEAAEKTGVLESQKGNHP